MIRLISIFLYSNHKISRIKRINIAGEIRNSEDVNRIARYIQNDFIIYNKVYLDSIKYLKKMNIDDLNEIIKSISLDNRSFVLMLPNSEN